MKEFAKDVFELLGVTLGAVIASVLGGVASLAFAKELTKPQAAVIVAAALGTGSFGSAGLIGYFEMKPVIAASLSFFLGFLAMPLLGLLFGVASRWRDRAPAIADKLEAAKLGADPENPRHPEAP